jgi:hypothetical protein
MNRTSAGRSAKMVNSTAHAAMARAMLVGAVPKAIWCTCTHVAKLCVSGSCNNTFYMMRTLARTA